jgi:plastocyanin
MTRRNASPGAETNSSEQIVKLTRKTLFGGLLFAAATPLVWLAGCDADGTAQRPVTQGPAQIEWANTDSAPGPTSPPATAAAAATASVSIDNFAFSPATTTVPVGTTVTWVNHDDAPHTVTANDKAFGSKALDTDDRYTHQFTAPGTYSYFCAVHTHMTGKVVVR